MVHLVHIDYIYATKRPAQNKMEVSISVITIMLVIVLIILGWSIYVIRRDRIGIIHEIKNQARLDDGSVSRERFAELIKEAILNGKWEP